MEITRRNFIQLLAGGTAGIHMTPLPWKLMDDIAIWTQNWPWVPVPEVGAFHHEKTVCSLCPGGCGIEVRKVDDRAVKIEGRTDYPVNPGGICPLGAGGLQLLYDETIRFTGPMKRVGPRGAGQFQPVSWKEALQTLAGRIQALRKEGRPEALAAVDGHRRDSTVGHLVERLLQAVGSPNTLRMPTIEDTYATANLLMQGTDGPMAYDLENADFILSFGCGLIEGWGAPGRVIDAWGRWHEDVSKKNEPQIAQAESRASNTASKADIWIAPKPGSEAALALGMAHVMIRENLVDGSFLSNYAHGFEDWTSDDGASHRGFKSVVLEKYVPETAAEITGVPREKIVALARQFGKAKSPLAVYGKGKGDLNGSVLECMAVQSLNALKGNINKPGGVMVYDGLPLARWAPVAFDAVANQGLARARLDGAAGPDYPLSESRIGAFPKAILESSGTPPVDTILVCAANPVFTLPDGGAFQKALEKIPFIVSFSPFRDETSVMADLVLPDHTALEKAEDVGWPTGLQYPFFGLSKPVVGPVYDTRHSGDVLIDLARAVGGSVGEAFPWKNFEAALKERVQGLAETEGLTSYDGSPVWERFAKGRSISRDYDSFDDLWDQLESGGFWYQPKHAFYTWSSCFQTPSGKFEFYSNRLAEAAQAAGGAETAGPALRKMGIEVQGDEAFMPHYEPVLPGRADEDTLMLIPYELFNLSTGWLPSPPYLTKTLFDTQLRKQDSFAEINPGTAAKHGLREGDRVTIQSDAGEVTARLHFFEGAMPGNLYLPLGLGHTEGGVYLKGKGANPTDLIVGGTDPVSGHIQWWGTRVRVKKA